jgi:hypothetical protein
MQNLTQMTTCENIQYVQNLRQMTEIFGLIELNMSEKIETVFIVEQVKANMKEIRN